MNERGFEKEVREDGIIIWRIHSTQRTIVDAWYADVAGEFAAAFAASKRTRFMYDVRQVSLANPYIMKRASDLAKLPLPVDWKVVTLVNSAFVKTFVSTIRAVSLTSQAMYERSQIFSNEAEALAWLCDQ